jgi:tetratricopeptide (TPR) repeat protein
LGVAELANFEGRFGEAERILRPAIATDIAAGEKESAADKLVSLAYVYLSWGQNKQAIDAAEKALSNSKRVTIRFLAARVFAETGEAARAHELASALSSELLVERQTYGKIIDGQIALQKKDLQNAIQLFTDANKSLDTWVGHFDLGRAYLEAGLFTEANSEFDACIKRRGESVELMDDGPSYGYFPPVYYYQGRVLEGLKSNGFSEAYRTYLTLRGQSTEDPLVTDARHRLPFSQQQ